MSQQPSEGDRHAIESVIDQLEAAWNRGAGTGFAASFAEDADFVNLHGDYAKGRQAIAEISDEMLHTVYTGSTTSFELIQLQMLSPEVALAHLRNRLHVPSGPKAGNTETRPSLVLTRRGETWEIASYQNTEIKPLPEFVTYGRAEQHRLQKG